MKAEVRGAGQTKGNEIGQVGVRPLPLKAQEALA